MVFWKKSESSSLEQDHKEDVVTFKQKYSFEVRKAKSAEIRERNPHCVPVIVEKLPRCKNAPDLNIPRFLAPADSTFGRLLCAVRARMKLEKYVALFFFVDNLLQCNDNLMGKIYEDKKDEDGFLYVVYTTENTFG